MALSYKEGVRGYGSRVGAADRSGDGTVRGCGGGCEGSSAGGGAGRLHPLASDTIAINDAARNEMRISSFP